MNLSRLISLIKEALHAEGDAIADHVAEVQNKGRSTGIEKRFSDALHRRFEAKGEVVNREQSLSKVGLQQFYPGRKGGYLDAHLPSSKTALEYKAVRLHRIQSNPQYDAGQILADFQRLREQQTMERAYVVAFLYCPLVGLAGSSGALYRTFHNQMFVDCQLAKALPGLKEFYAGALASSLGWDMAWGKPAPPPWAAAAKQGNLGAVAISALDEWH